MHRIPRDVARKLGFYVYLYIDPRTDAPFYVGKGVRNRVLAHLTQNGETRKLQVISQLRRVGLEPRLEILAHRLRDEEMALRIEAAAIDLLGIGVLTNRCRRRGGLHRLTGLREKKTSRSLVQTWKRLKQSRESGRQTARYGITE